MSLPTSARLTIDLDALAHNFAVLRAQAAGADAAPVIKADGYGLGAAQVARRLWAEGAQGFFVARLSEGESLRAALGAEHPATIYVLDGFLAGAGPRLAAARLTPVLSSLPQIEAATTFAAASGQALAVALQVDTGMNRQGLTLAEAEAVAQSGDRLGEKPQAGRRAGAIPAGFSFFRQKSALGRHQLPGARFRVRFPYVRPVE